MSPAPWRPELLDPDTDTDAARIAELRAAGVAVEDLLSALEDEIAQCAPDLSEVRPIVVYFPWRARAVQLPDARAFHRVRGDRNRFKIDATEAEKIAATRIGIAGLSTGYAIAMALVALGFQRFRLADFDQLELTNLNRIPASVLDIGLNKCVSAARRMAEINPFVEIEIDAAGVAVETCASFVDGLDQVMEVCDSFAVKVAIREACCAASIPVIMPTSDRSMLDVERFDLEPARPLFHGLAGDLTVRKLQGMQPDERVGLALRIVGAANVSTEMGASLFEIDRSLKTWPQLASDVTMGAGAAADIARRIATGAPVASGRSLGLSYLDLTPPAAADDLLPAAPKRDTDCQSGDLQADLVAAARLAPSGGNAQRWQIACTAQTLTIGLGTDAPVAMDIADRGSHVAIGAAWLNARVLAASRGALGGYAIKPAGATAAAVVSFGAGQGEDASGHLARCIPLRATNRRPFDDRPIPGHIRAALAEAAAREGGELVIFDGPDRDRYVDLLARAERLRFLSPRCHADLRRELIWPTEDPIRNGLDVRTLELSPPDLEKVKLAMRPDVMAALLKRNLGGALGDPVRDAYATSGLAVLVAIDGDGPDAFIRGGSALQRMWLEATNAGIWAQPWSPYFLYAHAPEEVAALGPAELEDEAIGLFHEWTDIAGLGRRKAVLSLRLGYGPPPTAVSLRAEA